jgi:radical SAM superfamily enzyme YgiQ (UPF0313 family)
MKAAVVVPPLEDFYFTHHRFSVLGVKTITSILEENGVETRLFNFPLMQKKARIIPLPPELSYLNPFILPGEMGKISFFTSYKHYGPPFEESAHMVAGFRPDIVFLSCFAFCYAKDTLEMAKAIKKILPGLPLVAGGAGITVFPDYFLENPHIDFALTGEAEVSLIPFIHALKTKKPFTRVPNLFWRTTGKIHPPSLWKKSKGNDLLFIYNTTCETPLSLFISTSLTRGCTKHCQFCSNYFEKELRTVPVEQIIEGSKKMFIKTKENKQICINFEDDNLLLRIPYFLRVLQALASLRRNIAFFIESGIDYTLLTPTRVKKLNSFGLKQFNLSLVSTNAQCCEAEGRFLNIPHYERIARLLTQLNIPSITYFICGLKNDTKETVVRNLVYLARQPTISGISLFYPIPGLPGFQDMNRFKVLSPSLCAGSSAYPWNGSLPTSTLVTAFRLSRYTNALKTKPGSDIEKELLTIIGEKQCLHTIIKENKKRRIIPVPEIDGELQKMFFKEISTLFL